MTLISKPLVSRYINRKLAQQASNTRRVLLGPVISLNSVLPPGDGNISVHHGSIFYNTLTKRSWKKNIKTWNDSNRIQTKYHIHALIGVGFDVCFVCTSSTREKMVLFGRDSYVGRSRGWGWSREDQPEPFCDFGFFSNQNKLAPISLHLFKSYLSFLLQYLDVYPNLSFWY